MSNEAFKGCVARYLQLRDERNALREKHSQEMAPFNAKLAELEAAFLKYLDHVGAKHVATDIGTVYKTERASVTVADWSLCLGHIMKNQLWHLLEKRVSKSAVEEYLTDTDELPPGVNMTRELTVNVRRS